MDRNYGQEQLCKSDSTSLHDVMPNAVPVHMPLEIPEHVRQLMGIRALPVTSLYLQMQIAVRIVLERLAKEGRAEIQKGLPLQPSLIYPNKLLY